MVFEGFLFISCRYRGPNIAGSDRGRRQVRTYHARAQLLRIRVYIRMHSVLLVSTLMSTTLYGSKQQAVQGRQRAVY